MLQTLATDIVAFAEAMYVVDRAWVPRGRAWEPVRDRPVVLFNWQKRLLYDIFPVAASGRPQVRNYLLAMPKKTGKTALAGIVAAYMAATEPHAEVYILASDERQARDRAYRSVVYAVEHGPLGDHARVQKDTILFSNGATIATFPGGGGWKGASGGEPVCVIVDEMHTSTIESERRRWDEFLIPPSVEAGIRFCASYAGYTGESTLLRSIWDTVLAGKKQGRAFPPLYHNDKAGWWGCIGQGERAYSLVPWGMGKRGKAYLAQARASERPLSYARLFRNEWVSAESAFVSAEQWDALIDRDLVCPEPSRSVRLVGGLDLATKHDSSAFVSVYHQDGRVCLGPYRIWRAPVSLGDVEEYILEVKEGYDLRRMAYDPYQAALLAERLTARGVKLIEFAQTTGRMTEAGNALFEHVKQGTLRLYPASKSLRSHVLNAQARETPRGLRLVKGATSKHIDAAIALAMAVCESVEAAPGQASCGPNLYDAEPGALEALGRGEWYPGWVERESKRERAASVHADTPEHRRYAMKVFCPECNREWIESGALERWEPDKYHQVAGRQ